MLRICVVLLIYRVVHLEVGRCQEPQPCEVGSTPGRRQALLGRGWDVKHEHSSFLWAWRRLGFFLLTSSSHEKGRFLGAWGAGTGGKGVGRNLIPCLEHLSLHWGSVCVCGGGWPVLKSWVREPCPVPIYIERVNH